jgi:hypothetical protein
MFLSLCASSDDVIFLQSYMTAWAVLDINLDFENSVISH